MARLDVKSSDLQWVEKVRSFLIDVARASLADIPKLPERVATDALPLAQQAQQIQQQALAFNPSSWQYQHQEWIENVRQLLLELSRMALSDSPRLPENLAQRALLLMETAQDLQEKLVDLRAETDPEVASPEMEIANPGLLLSNLRTQLNLMRDRHPHRDNPDWQNLFIALDEVEQYYRHLNQ